MPIRRGAIPLSRRFFHVCMAAAAEALEGAEILPIEYNALVWLHDDPEIDQNALAARMGVDRTTASTLVFSLEEKGLIERRINPADRRARQLRLTPEGEAQRARLRPRALECQERVLSVLAPSERELLLDLLVRVVIANEEYMRPGAARRKPSRKSNS